MNWVGGARSRLKVPNERRLQKEYFERKRLGTKTRDQTLDQTKAPIISKDLFFLSKAAENDYTDRSPRAVPNRVNLDSAVKHPARDLELPMSPIEKPSTLDLVDSSVVSSLNHSFYPPHLNTTALPKVSTMKLPRGSIMNDLEANQKRDKDPVLNISCVSEALFPAMRRSGHEKAVDRSSTDRIMATDKKYSLNELLDSSQIRDNLKRQLSKQKQAPSRGMSSKDSDDLLWASLGGMLGRKRPASSNTERERNLSKQPAKKPKKDLGYDFSGWLSKLEKSSGNGSKGKQMHDKDAMLEIYYAPYQPTQIDLPKVQQVRESEKQSWSLSTLLTENPFSNFHQQRSQAIDAKKPRNMKKRELKSLNSTVFDESVLGPIEKNRKNSEQPVMKKKKKNEEKRPTVFEKMMASFENSEKIELEDTMVGLSNVLADNMPPDNRPQEKRSSCWKQFVSGDEISLKEDQCNKHQPLVLKEKKSMNCSAWEELACLEQEAFAGLDTCTQELTLSPLDCTEEPLLRQVPDVTTKRTRNMYQFDSSQDSFISSKSYSEHHSQLASNEHASLPNSEKEIKLTTIFDQECAKAAVWPTVTMENTEIPVPAFSNIVEVVSATEGTNIATNDSQLNSDGKNSTPVSPATLSTQTSPSIQYATKHQEQQTCPTMQCVPLSSVVSLSTQPSPSIQYATKHQEQQTCPTMQCVPLSSVVSLSTQTSPSIQYATTKHQEQQTSPGTLQCVLPLQCTTTDATQPQSHTSLKSDKEYTSLKNAFTQAGLVYTRELTALKQEVNRLKEELGSAESTVIWQSLMLKIKDI